MIKTVIKRIIFVSFWIGTLSLFLYLPTIVGWFYKDEKSITVFTWPLVLDANYIKEFEKKTGIKVYLSYYESNEELLSKLKATGGAGYDIVIPSDYAAEVIIKEGLVKKIDRSQINFFDRIHTHLLDNYYDPSNEYSLPYYWSMYGLGIDVEAFGGEMPEPSWALIFDKHMIHNKVCMTDSAREAIMIAGQYLFGSIDVLHDGDNIEKVQQLLTVQKQWVEVYSDVRAVDLLASKNCAVVAALSPDINRVKREYPHLMFVTPKEGSFKIIDVFLLPVKSQKDEMVYQFLNYVYQSKVIKHNSEKYGFCSPVVDVVIDADVTPIDQIQHTKLDFFRNIISEEILNTVWINVMSQ